MRRRRVLGVLIVVAAASFAGYALARTPTATVVASASSQQLGYVDAAIAVVAKQDPGCGDALVEGRSSQGSPTALVSILGVLRRPASPHDVLVFPKPSGRFGQRVLRQRPPRPRHVLSWLERIEQNDGTVYVNYVRRARVAYGSSYYLIPLIKGSRVAAPTRCIAEQNEQLRRTLLRIPPSIRRSTLSLAASIFKSEQRVIHPYEAIELIKTDPQYGGAGGSCCSTASAIRAGHGGRLTSGGGTGNNPREATLSEIVPDGVASVTLYFPAAPFSGGPPPLAPGTNTAPYKAITITSRPVANVVAARIPRSAEGAFPQKETWRSANGTVIKDGQGAVNASCSSKRSRRSRSRNSHGKDETERGLGKSPLSHSRPARKAAWVTLSLKNVTVRPRHRTAVGAPGLSLWSGGTWDGYGAHVADDRRADRGSAA